MAGARPILRPRSTISLPTSSQPHAPAELLRQAIARRSCVVATYNGGRVKLAPHVLYNRDDALFVDAVTIERDGRAAREPKLGAFRLSGLKEVCLTLEKFQPRTEVPLEGARYAAGILARI